LEVNSDSITLSNLESSRAIAGFMGRNENPVNLGNPVINASYEGNYYAWSDSSDESEGIVVGYKSLDYDGNCMEALDTLAYSSGENAKHPSMNVYSLIDSSENNCSLVWQEKYNNNYQIFYTRLKFDTAYSILKHLIAPEKRSKIVTSKDSIIKLSDASGNNSFPVIYRSISPTNLKDPSKFISSVWWNPNRYEKIYWEYNKSFSYWMDNISGVNIFSRDSADFFKEIGITTKAIISSLEGLFNPNLSQNLYFYYPQYNNSLEIFNLNIKSSSGIYQLNLENSLFLCNTSSIDWGVPNIFSKITNTGILPHLSKNIKSSEIISNNLQYAFKWKNRRVYSSGIEIPPNIFTSAKSFYRQNDDESIYQGYAGYCSNTFYFYVGNTYLNGDPVFWKLPYEEIEDTLVNEKYYIPIIRDSIFTTAFNVAPQTSAHLDFTVYALSSESTTIGLEGHPSNTFVAFPLPVSTTDSTNTLMQYTIINMADVDYRVIFINHDTTAEYSERLFIGGLPIGDTVLANQGESNIGRIIIDLETGQTRKLTEAGKMELTVFPNPAKDEVYVTVNYPVKYLLENSGNINKAKVRLFSLTGEKLFDALARPGETIRIPTGEYTQGLYFIQAEEKIDKWQLDYLAPAVERVFIQK